MSLKAQIVANLTGEPISGADIVDAMGKPHDDVYTALVELEASGHASLSPITGAHHQRGWVIGWAALRGAA